MGSKVQVTIELDDKGAMTRITGIDQALDKVGTTGGKAFGIISAKSLTAVVSVTALVGAAKAAGDAFWNSTLAAANYGDEIAKASQKFGVGVGALSELRYAAELGDVSFEKLGIGLKKLAESTIEAQAGTKQYAEAFNRLGITVTDTHGILKSQQELMLEIADRFATMRDGAEKTALAVDIFGRSGADLIPMLNGGSAAIEEASDKAQRFGLVLSENAARSAEQFNDNLTDLQMMVTGFQSQLGSQTIPVFNALIESITNNKEITDLMAKAAQWLGQTVVTTAISIADLVRILYTADAGMQGFAASTYEAIAAVQRWNPLVSDSVVNQLEEWAKAARENQTESMILASAALQARMEMMAAAAAAVQLGSSLTDPVEKLQAAASAAKLMQENIQSSLGGGAVIPPGGTQQIPYLPPGVFPRPRDVLEEPYSPNGPIPPGGTIPLPGMLPGLDLLTPDKLAPQFSAMSELGSLMGSLTEKTGLWGDALYGVGDAMGQFASGNASLGESFKQLAVSIVAGIAKESAVKAVYNIAEGIAALTNPATAWKAPLHFKAAAVYGTVAAVAGAAGAMMSGGSSGVGARGGAFNPVTTTSSSMSLDLSARNQQNAEIARLNATITRLETKITSMKPSEVVTVAASSQGGIMAYAQPRQDYRSISTRVYDEPLI